MSKDGMNYAPVPKKVEAVVSPGEFVFAASHFDHGHIYGQIGGLARAGGVLKAIYEPEHSRHQNVLSENPGAKVVDDFREILDDSEIKLVTSAAIPHQRCEIGLQVLESGKDYLTDKSPFTTLGQLESARTVTEATGQKYMVCFSERLCNESAWYAGELIRDGVIGDVVSVVNLAPHNLAADTRPEWFFDKECYGGILTDIGSHQFEQFLHYSNATDASLNFARVENFGSPHYEGLEDFGEASLTTDNGASCYCRLDWFNPGGLRTWGDGRSFVVGMKGTIEIRKYIDVANPEKVGDVVLLVDGDSEQRIECAGKVGFPFFGQLILDVLNRTEHAMTQEHAFKAAELSMKAQELADQQRPS